MEQEQADTTTAAYSEAEKYAQDGSTSERIHQLPNLKQIEPSILPQLKHMSLTSITIEPEDLLNSLDLCTNLEILVLSKVDMNSSFGNHRSVTLPKLKTFFLELGLNTEIGDYNKKEVFASWFPFFNSNEIYEQISNGRVNLELIGPDDGCILKLNYDAEELISHLRWTNEVLENIRFNLRKLVIFQCGAVVKVQSFKPTLTQLEFTEVQISDGKMSDVLLKCSALEYLYMSNPIEDAQLNLFELQNCPNLKGLWLVSDTKVTGYTSAQIRFESLTELILDWRVENFDENIIENLENIFPNLQTVVLVMHNKLVNSLLRKTFQLKSVNKIAFKTFYIREFEIEQNVHSSLAEIVNGIDPDEDYYFYLEKELLGDNWTGKVVKSDNYGPFLRGLLKSSFVALF